ncbi:hypothetical protein BH11CYA1_BH11CYA1_34320 [soil metagenome]
METLTSALPKLKMLGLLLVLACNCQAAQAMLLSGQVEERAETLEQIPGAMPASPSQRPAQGPAPQSLQSQPISQSQPTLQNQQGRQDQLRTSPPRPNQANLKPSSSNTFPATYQGAWYCETTVVDSTLPAVLQGQVIGSEVVFFPSTDGAIHARWNQPGWVETQSQAITFNGTEAKADRTTYYFGDNMQGSWAARARDQFAQTAPDLISAKSYVDQYVDGQYLGRYRTVSVLKRSGNSQNMASMN